MSSGRTCWPGGGCSIRPSSRSPSISSRGTSDSWFMPCPPSRDARTPYRSARLRPVGPPRPEDRPVIPRAAFDRCLLPGAQVVLRHHHALVLPHQVARRSSPAAWSDRRYADGRRIRWRAVRRHGRPPRPPCVERPPPRRRACGLRLPWRSNEVWPRSSLIQLARVRLPLWTPNEVSRLSLPTPSGAVRLCPRIQFAASRLGPRTPTATARPWPRLRPRRAWLGRSFFRNASGLGLGLRSSPCCPVVGLLK